MDYYLCYHKATWRNLYKNVFMGRIKSVFARHVLEIVTSDCDLPPNRQNCCRGLWISIGNISSYRHPKLNGLVKNDIKTDKRLFTSNSRREVCLLLMNV